MKIRHYQKEEYYNVLSWWEQHEECAPTKDMLPEESTFILEENGIPWVCITLYLTNSKEFAWIDNLVANPAIKKSSKEAVNTIVEHVEKFAKNKGYKKLFCMAIEDKLGKRYQELGYNMTCNSVKTFLKDVQ